MLRLFPLAVLAALVPTLALAGPCDRAVAKGDTATGEALVKAFAEVAACDTTVADSTFSGFMRRSTDVQTGVALALVAIDNQVYSPVWTMMDGIRDYGQRDAISKAVGASCTEHPQVVQFLQGAYYGLRDIQFVAWDDALITCTAPPLLEWIQSIVAAPPSSLYDEKYNAVTEAWVQHNGVNALPVLQRAAIASSLAGGPFNMLIEKMEQAIRPRTLGEKPSPEHQAKLEEALVAIANEVAPEQAAMVADRLYNAGAVEAAALLLRRVYPDRVTEAGRLLYGAASVERCDGQAILHYALVMEPARRWAILGDIEEPMRAFRPRLKCTTDGAWPVIATSEPVKDAAEVDAWAERQRARLAEEGLSAKTRKEKDVVLP